MKKIFLFTFCCFCLVVIASAQEIPRELKAKLEGRTKFTDIMREVNKFYLPSADLSNKILVGEAARSMPKPPRAVKKWARWAQWMEGRLDENGNVFDFQMRTYQEMQRYEASHSQNREQVAAGGNWVLFGPDNVYYGYRPGIGLGRVDRIAFHPSNPDILYAGTPQGGLWRSTNGGSNWSCLTNSLPNLSVSGIVVSHANANTIYVLTGDGDSGGLVANFQYRRGGYGVVKSTDGGASWTILPQGDEFGRGFDLKQDPNNANVLLAATTAGLFRTADGGNSWTKILSATIHNISYDASGNYVYATGVSGGQAFLSISITGGITWGGAPDYNIPITGAVRMSVAASTTTPGRVYLLVGKPDDDNGGYGGFYRSTDYGGSFFRTSSSPNLFKQDDGSGSPQATYDNTLCVRPDDGNIIITGGLVCFRSSNAGSSFGAISQYFVHSSINDEYYIHPDIHQVAYNPLNNMLYACTDGGIWRSSDNGSNWGGLYNNMPVATIYHMDVYDGNHDYVGIGTQDNGIKLRQGSGTSSFSHAKEGDGYRIQYFHDDADRMYVVINNKVIKLLTNGLTQNELFSFYAFFPSLAIHETDNQRFYCGLNQFVGADNSGGTISYGTRNVPVSWCITTCPSNSSRIYGAGRYDYNFGDNGIMARSDDEGDTWENLTNKPGFPAMNSSTKITDIAVNPTNSNLVFVTIGGFVEGTKVYFSSNAGDNWVNITGSLPNVPVNCVAVDSDNNAYIGNDFGVFYRGNGWVDWKPFYNGLPRVPVTDLDISESLNRVRAATFGRSIFSSDRYSDCPPELIVSSDQEGQRFHEASSITTTAKSQDGAGTEVFYRASNKVDMLPGFEVKNKSLMKAYTGPCSSGLPVFRMAAADQSGFSGFRKSKLPSTDNKKFGFAYIRNWKWEGSTLRYTLEQVKDGNIQLILVDEEGQKLETILPGQNRGVGSYQFSTPITAKDKKLCLLVMHDNALVHWQELN